MRSLRPPMRMTPAGFNGGFKVAGYWGFKVSGWELGLRVRAWSSESLSPSQEDGSCFRGLRLGVRVGSLPYARPYMSLA